MFLCGGRLFIIPPFATVGPTTFQLPQTMLRAIQPLSFRSSTSSRRCPPVSSSAQRTAYHILSIKHYIPIVRKNFLAAIRTKADHCLEYASNTIRMSVSSSQHTTFHTIHCYWCNFPGLCMFSPFSPWYIDIRLPTIWINWAVMHTLWV